MIRKLLRLISRYSRGQRRADANTLTNEEYCAKYGHNWVAMRLKGRWEQKECVRCGATRVVDIINS